MPRISDVESRRERHGSFRDAGAEESVRAAGDVNIAYQVVGDGPVDLVFVNGLVAHMDLWWVEPEATAMLERLASFSCLILFDKPGTGLSDPVIGAPTIEQRMEDLRAVMDAAGSERAFVIGYSEGGYPAARFAAPQHRGRDPGRGAQR